jgi:hypothetical protein
MTNPLYDEIANNAALRAEVARLRGEVANLREAMSTNAAYWAGQDNWWREQMEKAQRTIRRYQTTSVIDAAHLDRQRAWSARTFGPGDRTAGVIDHIKKELVEVEAQPDDVEEWADILILGFDGALRAGHEPQAIIDAIKAKQAKNEARTWPDWRTMPADKAIEHVR